MLNTKEHLKQIEMDTIQQEPLLTELTPEAAATVEGGIRFKALTPLSIRSAPRSNSRRIGSFRNGEIFDATNNVTNGFRRLTLVEAINETERTVAWVPNSLISKV